MTKADFPAVAAVGDLSPCENHGVRRRVDGRRNPRVRRGSVPRRRGHNRRQSPAVDPNTVAAAVASPPSPHRAPAVAAEEGDLSPCKNHGVRRRVDGRRRPRVWRGSIPRRRGHNHDDVGLLSLQSSVDCRCGDRHTASDAGSFAAKSTAVVILASGGVAFPGGGGTTAANPPPLTTTRSPPPSPPPPVPTAPPPVDPPLQRRG